MGKGKKNRKQDDDWENDLDEIAKEAGIDMDNKDVENDFDTLVTMKKEKKKKKGKQTVEAEPENEDQEDEMIIEKKGKAKPSFAALALPDEENNENDKNDSPDEGIEVKQETKTKKKKEKKKGKAKQEEEDIDELLNELEINDTKEKSSKKAKKKKKKDQEDLEVEDMEAALQENENNTEHTQEKTSESQENKTDSITAQEGEESGVIKTAAQKRAEKKEREKKKKEEEKKKAAKKKKKAGQTEESEDVKTEKNTEAESTTDLPKPVEESVNKEPSGETEQKSDGEGEKDETKEKKKKKKKKKDDEADKKKTKKPNKAAILKMQEALELAKKEEERLRAEEEAKQLAFEKAEEARLEKIRLEQERKDKKKQKEKERKERLKKEGKLLTAAQKEQKRKAEAMLEAMRQQGIIVPNKEDTGSAPEKPKKVVYGKKKKQPRQNQQQIEEPANTAPVNNVEVKHEIEVKTENEKKIEENNLKESEVVDSWDADVADSWDAEEVADNWDVDTEVKPVAVDSKIIDEIPKGKELEKQISEKSAEEEDNEDDDEEESSSEEEESGSEDDDETDSEESSSEEESSSDDEDSKLTPEKIKERARERIEKRRFDNEAKRSLDRLRAPVICVLGHVDTGKTKILDKIRRTNVQDGEAGGITQQIGATNVPVEKIKEQTKMVKEFQKFDLKLPGLLIIDTPGHESFSNLRSRGSNLCDMAILVVDIMHGLEPQTIESINLLRKKQTPFVVALNKIDRLYDWSKAPDTQVEQTIKKQKRVTKQDFDERSNAVISQFAEQGLNAALHYQNPDEKVYISLVPTSAHSGDGMGDLMAIICRLTQARLAKKLAFSDELQCTVMEVKALPGLGTTIDAILVNGRLKEGDMIVTGGIDGAIVSQIRSVLTPQPMRELRVKAQYIHHQCLEAAQGVKLCAKDLDKVLAGSPLYVAHQPDEVEVLKEEVEEFVSSSLKAIKVSERGVYVQASTLGSLEALLEFLKTSKIPYCGVNIGPVHKKDIMRCSVMLEHEPMYAVVLAFDVKVERDAQEFADKEGVKIFSAEIIYHLFDQFTAYCEDYKEKKREEFKHLAVYPCKLRVLPEHIFNTRDPIVLGVNIESGSLRLGTPLIVPSQNRINIGFVTGIEANHKQLDKAFQNQDVCVKIEPVPGEAPRLYGRHFTHEDTIVSKITRESIDVMKQYFREDMAKSDWQLIIELKKKLDIV